MKLKVAIGADHSGLNLKKALAQRLGLDYEVADMGAYEFDPEDDYPDFTLGVVRAVASGEAARGIIICGSGVGACIAANKVSGIRACLCQEINSARQGVEHDDMNVLCLAVGLVSIKQAMELATAFLEASFTTDPRYRRRLERALDIERRALQMEE